MSDYYYGATPNYWTLPGNNSSKNDYRKAVNDNWLYTGLYEWTTSNISDTSKFAFGVGDSGLVGYGYVDRHNVLRPTFNLTSSVQYDSGSGTASDPIRLKI